ncbi:MULTISPECIES: hypothetical protein [Methylorubrum]|jgi:hypothetical protein|nr:MULTISPECIES: hypothetical protein [Methylorubrum]MBA9069796.1 hypothetical protein [Methylobacterium sp. RAS18]MDF9866145.1 hypothetical protein [Methylorubrum pseudosasae]MDH6639692.1 hypothetical protein [Methylobacterium sp. SuP10 SLI 274]MCP1536058.1 hypothetical protein [Methylorubrum extorquens]MCP1542552.1 hypothetical protein [Methylorubrum extorquens]
MANKRALSWSVALRDLKDDRSRRADVREERLRTMAGLRGVAAPALSAWRGRSGRRYVVGVHELAEPDLAEVDEAVVIAVRRDEAGIAQAVSIAATGKGPRERLHRNWLARARQEGATEMHVHRLAEGETERRAVVLDLAADTEQGNA